MTLRRLLRRLTAEVNSAYAYAADSASHCQSISTFSKLKCSNAALPAFGKAFLYFNVEKNLRPASGQKEMSFIVVGQMIDEQPDS